MMHIFRFICFVSFVIFGISGGVIESPEKPTLVAMRLTIFGLYVADDEKDKCYTRNIF